MQYKPNLESVPEIEKGMLPVTEIFYSLQGEGRHSGYPSIFIRLKYCNLGCSWCDTRFTWDKKLIEPGELLSNDDILTKALKILEPVGLEVGKVRVVLTGGEPMLHQEKLPDLIRHFKDVGFELFDVETNGMFKPNSELLELVSWWNCSPKLANNGIDISESFVAEALEMISKSSKADFKFVVKNLADIDEIEERFLPAIRTDQIMLMPEGWTQKKQLESMSWVLEECTKRGFRFSPRLHILVWNNERAR